MGLTVGRSTLTNLLKYDVNIAEYLTMVYPDDNIMTFDFSKAFGKLPYQCVIEAAATSGILCKALKWLTTFLSERTLVKT